MAYFYGLTLRCGVQSRIVIIALIIQIVTRICMLQFRQITQLCVCFGQGMAGGALA